MLSRIYLLIFLIQKQTNFNMTCDCEMIIINNKIRWECKIGSNGLAYKSQNPNLLLQQLREIVWDTGRVAKTGGKRKRRLYCHGQETTPGAGLWPLCQSDCFTKPRRDSLGIVAHGCSTPLQHNHAKNRSQLTTMVLYPSFRPNRLSLLWVCNV